MHAAKTTFWFVILLVLTGACAKSSLSQRDARREQMRNMAEAKRLELSTVRGRYIGSLLQTGNAVQVVSLDLHIRDIPQAVDGEVDPVPTPILTGFLRFILGDGPEDFISLGIDKAEFDPKRSRIDVVCSNDQIKEMTLALNVEGQKLSGNWTAPKSSTSGRVALERQDDEDF